MSKKDAPKFFQKFIERFPQVAEHYEALGNEVHGQGPLNERERALIKLAISGSAGLESAFKVHVRKAHKLGVCREEMEHVALLLLPTRGFPVMMKAMRLIDEEFDID
jgi:4-carboxymuconolactone decarboxylase